MPSVPLNVHTPVTCELDLEFGHAKVDEMVGDYRRLYERYRSELEHERELGERLQHAIALDSQKFAEALTDGDESEPSRARTIKAEQLLDASRRRRVAIARRLNSDYAPTVQTIAKHGRQIRAQAREDERRASKALLERLLGLGDAFDELHRARRVVAQIDWYRGNPDSGIPPAGHDEVLLNYDVAGELLAARAPSVPYTIENLLLLIGETLNRRAAEDEPAESVAVDATALERVETPFVPTVIGSPSPAELERAARQAG